MSVMKAQLEKILRLADEGKVEVRIIPFEIGVYTAVDSNFDFLEFGVSALPQLVFVEGLTSNLYLERDADLERYREAIEYLRDAALSPRDSAARIAGANDAFAKHHF
jgi:hypothetical protein